MSLKMLIGPLFLLLCLSGCRTHATVASYAGDTLKVEQLTTNTFRHISYLSIEGYGKFGCNGMVVRDGGEALVIDAPVDDAAAKELVDWVENILDCRVVGVLATHFHNDCLGGISEFHERGIPYYASSTTMELAKADGSPPPQRGFNDYLEVAVGKERVVIEFPGEGHTVDNVVAYFPKERVLFGGCLVKALGAGKGNLADAVVGAWPETVSAVKSKYGEARVVVPGHGEPGGVELLEYTVELFRAK